MTFKIPLKSFLSFSKKQTIDTLWRMARQIEDKITRNSQAFQTDVSALLEYINYIHKHHPSTSLQLKTGKLFESLNTCLVFDASNETLNLEKYRLWVLDLERSNKMDLKDENYLISTEDKIDTHDTTKKLPVDLILDNLRSSFNVGSLFRTCESFGVSRIHLCGYTPTPENSKTAKSSLGTQNWINWQYWESTHECMQSLKQDGFRIYAFETEDKATDIKNFKFSYPHAIILGNERYGLSEPTLDLTDQVLKIEMFGNKNSLNVGICGALAIYQATQQYNS